MMQNSIKCKEEVDKVDAGTQRGSGERMILHKEYRACPVDGDDGRRLRGVIYGGYSKRVSGDRLWGRTGGKAQTACHLV